MKRFVRFCIICTMVFLEPLTFAASDVAIDATRNNWGLLSLFETNVLDQPVLVLVVAGQFVPLRGVEEASLRVGRLAF